VNVTEGQESPTEQNGAVLAWQEQCRGISKARDRKDSRRSPRAWHVARDRCETWEAHTGPERVRGGNELELRGCRCGSQTDS
jgi:hypothetical protein